MHVYRHTSYALSRLTAILLGEHSQQPEKGDHCEIQ